MNGRMIVQLCAFAAGLPVVARAQEREVKTYSTGTPEAKLMLYYSSSVAFSPLGVPFNCSMHFRRNSIPSSFC